MSTPASFTPILAPGAPERMAVIDLDAVRSNVRRVREAIGERTFIAVVKANAYGHGAVEVGRAALEAGADMLGVVHVREALALREAGISGPILAWIHTVNTDFEAALAADLTLGVSTSWELGAIADAARALGKVARVHLKVDTGLGRNGFSMAELAQNAAYARSLEEAGAIEVEGIFSHLAVADEPERKETAQQAAVFAGALDIAREAGLNPSLIHLGNTPATFTAAEKEDPALLLCNGVRVGLGLYGLSPLADKSSQELGLRPVMTLQTFINNVKEVPAGQGVSYGLNYVTDKPTTLALVPLGYADGVPRVATSGPVRIYPSGAPAKTYREVGRIAMDQMVVDLGEPGLSDPALGYLGAPVVLFGSGQNPPVEDWADAAGTINYEVVTRISDRVERVYLGKKNAENS